MWGNYSNIQKFLLVIVPLICLVALGATIFTRELYFLVVATIVIGMPWGLIFSYLLGFLTDVGWHSATMVFFGVIGAYLNWRLLIRSPFAKETTSQVRQLPQEERDEVERKAKRHLRHAFAIQYAPLIVIVLVATIETFFPAGSTIATFASYVLIGTGLIWLVATLRSAVMYVGYTWRHWPLFSSTTKKWLLLYCVQLILFTYLLFVLATLGS